MPTATDPQRIHDFDAERPAVVQRANQSTRRNPARSPTISRQGLIARQIIQEALDAEEFITVAEFCQRYEARVLAWARAA